MTEAHLYDPPVLLRHPSVQSGIIEDSFPKSRVLNPVSKTGQREGNATSERSIPAVVARKEEAWKAVKDVLRDVIDGQPKRGDFWDDYNNSNGRVYSGYVQTKDDALQAYEALAGRDWYDFAGGRANCGPAKMRVGCLEVWQGGWQSIAGPSDVPVEPNTAHSDGRSAQHENRSITGRHGRVSSTSSSVRFSLSPVAAYYGLRTPTFSPGAYPQPAMPIGNPVATSMAHLMPNTGLPPPAKVLTYAPNEVGRTALQPRPSASSQAPAMPLRATEQPPARNTVILTNLYSEVKEHQLAQRLGERIGAVPRCRIERRGDRKCHAFATFANTEQAQRAVRYFNGQTLFDRKITVRLTKEGEGDPEAAPREDRESGPIIADGSK
ncbi:MAG: hypothetical protein Q9207_004752 [Kuettlingeria erythrocarpa]